MGRFFQILAIFLLPVVLVGGVYLAGLTIPVPHLGRDYVISLVLPEAGQPVDLPKIYGPPDNSRPLVVIDAGHGGKDPGTVSGDRYEKDVVLELALALSVGRGLAALDDRQVGIEEAFADGAQVGEVVVEILA